MLDLTPDEVIMLVVLLNQIDAGVMIFHENVLHTVNSHPVAKTLIEKVQDESEREDVLALLTQRTQESLDEPD